MQPEVASNGLDEHWGPPGLPRTVAVAPREPAVDGRDQRSLDTRTSRQLSLSGKTDQALRDLAGRYLTWLDQKAEALATSDGAADELLADMAWTASVGRSHFPVRAGLTFRDAESLRDGLRALAAAAEEPGRAPPQNVAFVYTGQGSQWVGMGEDLYRSEPVVRDVLDRCDAVFRNERGTSLLDVMFGRPGAKGDLHNTAWAQPAVYALECALTALWASVGIRPSVAMGHSLGEIAAAQAAGVFGLEDGMRFVTKRGASLSLRSKPGAMAAIFASEPEVTAAMREVNVPSGDASV